MDPKVITNRELLGAPPDEPSTSSWREPCAPTDPENAPPPPVRQRLYSRRHAWLSVLLWAFLLTLFLPLALYFTEQIQGTLVGIKGSPTEVVRENVVKNFSTSLAFPTALVWDARDVPAEQGGLAWKEFLDVLRADPALSDLNDGTKVLGDKAPIDWHVAFLSLKAQSYSDAEKLILPLRTRIKADAESLPGSNKPWLTGGPALFMDLNVSSTSALRRGEMIALPITFIILLIVFRSLIASLLPVLVAILGVICTLGTLSLCTPYMTMTFFVPNLVTMIGLGVGIDYCLIYLARYRREKANHLTTQEALRVTRKTAGKTVMASAILVMSGFLALLLVPLEFFESIALGGVLVVFAVAVATLTLLPALIFILGPVLEWGHLPLPELGKMRQRLNVQTWSTLVIKHPWICILTGLLILDVLAWPALHLRVGSIQVKNLPSQTEARQGYQSLMENLGPGWMMPAIILVQHPDASWNNPDGAQKEAQLVEKLGRLPNTEKVITFSDETGGRRAIQARDVLLTSSTEPNQNIILALSRTDPQSPAARVWLDQIDWILRSQEVSEPLDARYSLGGLPAVTLEADRIIFKALPKVIFATLCTTFVLLLFFMRALFVPLKAIALNMLCVMAAYGFQVMVFQYHWGAELFHFVPTEGLNTIVLVICFCTLFGLSMDYEVFILSAVRESWLDHHNIKLAIQEGLQRTAGIITSAAIIMISVFLCFAFGEVVETQQLGVGLSFAVFLDATVIRMLCVPAAMVLLGDWNFSFPLKKYLKAEAEKH